MVWMILGFFLVVGLSWNKIAESVPSAQIQPSFNLTDSSLAGVSLAQLKQQGQDFYQSGDYQTSVQIWREMITRQTDQLTIAAVYGNLSLSLQKLGEWQPAQLAIQSSLKLLETLTERQDKTVLSAQAQALSIQAHLDFSQGKYSQALDNWQAADKIYQTTENDNGRIEILLNQVQAFQGLGLYRRAEQKLIEINQSLQHQPNSSFKVSQLLHLSHVLRTLGKLGEIKDIKSNGCDLSNYSNNNDLENTELSAAAILSDLFNITNSSNTEAEFKQAQFSLANLAREIYRQQQDLDNFNRSQNAAQTALLCYQQAAQSSVPMIQTKAKLSYLSLLLELNQELEPDQDIDLWQNIQSKINHELTQWQEIELNINRLPLGRTQIYATVDLAKSLMKLAPDQTKLYGDIQQLLLSAAEQAEALGDRRVQSYVWGYLGQLYEQHQQWQEAKNYTRKALLLSQSIQADEISYQWQWQLGRLLKQQQNSDIKGAIFAYTGAVQTLQSLRQDLVAIRQDIQFDFRDRVEPVYRELVDLLLAEEHPTAENLQQAKVVIEQLKLAELDNFFRDACLDAQPQAIDKIDPNAVVIYGIILTDRLEIITSLPNSSLFHYRTSVSDTELIQTLKRLRFLLQKPYPSPEVKQLSQQAYRWLLQPLESQLNGDETLVFVLDGELRNIPMAALSDGSQYLIEKYPVVMAPGLQLLDPKPITRPLNALSAGLVEPPASFQDQFAPLLNIPEELQKIQAVGIKNKALLNEEFNWENFEKQLTSQPFKVIHLATHGQFSSQAENTFILAADGPINVKQLDNLFRSREQNQGNAIDLLVLSACETAPGDNRAVLGLAGVAVRAGARSTIASLWSLNDKSAVEFMGYFYQQLVQGSTRAEALRQAQIAFIKDKNRYDTPVYWAPYVLVGNWR
jgi:CHAT domain-containing protein